MRKLNTASISPTVGMPIKSAILDFLQSAHQETIRAAILQIIGTSFDQTKVYILWGCNSSSSGGSTTITMGALFANDEVYLVGNQTIPNPTAGHVIVGNLLVGGSSGEPVIFTDLVGRNVLNNRICVFDSSVASGTGNINPTGGANNDYNNFIRIDSLAWISGSSIVGTGWGTYGPNPFVYTKDLRNRVQVQGAVISTSSSPSGTIATLPSGFQPIGSSVAVAFCCVGLNATTPAFYTVYLTVNNIGEINFLDSSQLPTATGWLVLLSSIEFLAI